MAPASFLVQVVDVPPPPPVPSGWTAIPAQTTGETRYVAYDGNDSNDGLTRGAAWLTWGKVNTWLLANDGKDNHVVTDFPVGNEYVGKIGEWGVSGIDADHPVCVYGYNRARSHWRVPYGATAWLWTDASSGVTSYVRIYDQDVRETGHDGAGAETAVSLLNSTDTWLFENCYISDWRECMTVIAYFTPATRHQALTINRCVFTNTFDTVSHSQGGYFEDIDGLSIVDTTLDRCGWDSSGTYTGTRTVFNHGVYIQHNNTSVTVSGCIAYRCSADGIKLRSGGTLLDNYCIRNPVNFNVGDGTTHAPAGVALDCRGNIAEDSEDIASGSGERAFGFHISNLNDNQTNLFQDNYAIHRTNGTSNIFAFSIDPGDFGKGAPLGIRNLTIDGNFVRGWGGVALNIVGSDSPTVQSTKWDDLTITDNTLHDAAGTGYLIAFTSDPDPGTGVTAHTGNRYYSTKAAASRYWMNANTTFAALETEIGSGSNTEGAVSAVDPDRNIESYMTSIGGTATAAAFVAGCAANEYATWDTDYTAEAAGTWVKAGFVDA